MDKENGKRKKIFKIFLVVFSENSNDNYDLTETIGHSIKIKTKKTKGFNELLI